MYPVMPDGIVAASETAIDNVGAILAGTVTVIVQLVVPILVLPEYVSQ